MPIRKYLARIKRRFFKKDFIKDKRYVAYWLDHLLGHQAAFLVQIGSNDGKTGDPLYPLLQKNKNWKALFVEPVPNSFEKLKHNYPDTNRFRFENVAINEGKAMPFYWVDAKAKVAIPNLPYWFDQLGSFNKQHILKHFDGTLAPFMQEKLLEGLTLKTLFERNKITNIDVLHIDTEGYDWNILSQLELSKFTPTFILYEHNHLSDTQRTASIQFLKNKYYLFDLGIDILSVSKKIDTIHVTEMKKYMQIIK